MNTRPISQILKETYLFSFMNDEELETLTKISSISTYDKDALLFMQGERSEHLLVLVEGLVSVYKYDDKGNEIIIGFFKPFSLIAEPAILKKVPFPSSAVFKTEGTILKIELDAFEKDFIRNPRISYEIIQSLINKIQLLQKNIHMNIASTAKEKIVHFYKQNPSLGEELKKYEIATLLGMTAETLSRNIKILLTEKKLEVSAKAYKVL
ncbi:MAG TPA: Crp/Fnr family transcriptional regulator [Sulfurimonas sp.]|nr:Crp/Fnr family transcriptional regulator [Sulfurimonas sp.]